MSKVLRCSALVLLCVTLLSGTAVAKTNRPSVQQVHDQETLVIDDTGTVFDAYQLYDLAQVQSTCEGQVEHVAALSAMARPKQYPKATWKILMRAADLYAKGASGCVATLQAALATKEPRDLSGLKQVNSDWHAGNALLNKADAALRKAKIS